MKKFLLIVLLLAFCASSVKSDAQIVTTIAGRGTSAHFGGDGGPATAADIWYPSGMCMDHFGNLIFVDRANVRIRKIDAAGIITTIAGTGTNGYSGDGGPASVAKINQPESISIDNEGNLYISDRVNFRIRKIDAYGIISTFAGTGVSGYSGDGGPASAAQLTSCWHVACDIKDNKYITDAIKPRIRLVNTDGIINTIAGSDTAGFSGDGGPATAARLGDSYGIAIDPHLNFYFADVANVRIRKVDSSGIITTICGNGTNGFTGDGGPATAAQIYDLTNIALDPAGNLYLFDAGNNRVRRIDPAGIITTVAGNGTAGFSGDGGPATAAEFYGLVDGAVDSAGNLYVSDNVNNRIRYIAFNRMVTYAAGSMAAGALCAGSAALPLDSLLAINDADTSQTETWTVVTPPARGTLSGLPAHASSTGSTLLPAGVTYTPPATTGGIDTLAIKVCDGHAVRVINLYFTITPVPNAGTITGPDSLCPGTTVTLTDTTATSGTWATTNTTRATISGTGTLTGVATGTDTVVYTAANACGADTTLLPVYIKPQSACNAGIATITTEDWKIFPNPADDELTIANPAAAGVTAGYAIVDVLGKTLLAGSLQPGNQQVDLSSLAPGNYILQLHRADGAGKNQLFVKE